MPPEDRKYVRVYHDDLIRDYPEIWANDAALATWLRMLATADPLWPTPPELPRSTKARVVAKLVACGLVIEVSQHRFRIKGLDAERTKRQDAARNAAAQRWHSGRNATSNAEPMPNRAEPNRAEPTRAMREENGREPVLIDEQTMTLEERSARYIERQERLTGVKA